MQGPLEQDRRGRDQLGLIQPLGTGSPAAEAEGNYTCSDLQVRRIDTVQSTNLPNYREVWATFHGHLVLLGLCFDLHWLLYQCTPTSNACLHDRLLEDTHQKTRTSTTVHMLNVYCPSVILCVRCFLHNHVSSGWSRRPGLGRKSRK